MKVTLGASAALAILGAATVATITRGHRKVVGAVRSPSGLTTTLAIESFRGPESAGIARAQMSFAESLAAHLKRMPGLEVWIAADERRERTDFILRGDIRKQDGRFVIVSRLYETGKEPPVWTATFWGDRAANPRLVDDLAADVAEALYGNLARRSATATQED